VRRTQEERRAETRTKLLEATIRCLLDEGYAGTTTRRVTELAGVSQGAQTYHFPYRVDLVGAAIEHLAQRRIAELHELAADLPADTQERIAAVLDVIWTDFSSSTFTVFVKVWVAAADDPELYHRLVPIERQLAQAIMSLATDFLGDMLSRVPDWERRVLIALSTLRGLALSEHFEPRARRRRDPWPTVRATLLETLIPESMREKQ